ncbi:MAG: FKBP-type peptidyl-prolyl cis-trans isomerase [Burkholderiales bacterium]|jgi:FKBP-type peptidyl-prolyl cis-trans isomerase FkpA|nr:FKBP-type peptidyl-prolyl cis-trans isomerase [Burkholderiales bacterium]
MPLLRTRRSALLLAFSASLVLAACGGGGGDSGTPTNTDPNGWNAVTALKVTDTTVGTGAQADTTKTVAVNYTGYIYDVRVANTKGTQFDTSVGKTPLSFKLGSGAVIPGFDQGVTGMKVGGKRTVTIPAALAYGTTGAGGGVIPPNAALVFDLELMSVN